MCIRDRTSNTPAGLADFVVPVLARGGLYGLNADTGEPLWQRWIGFRTRVSPVVVDETPGADILVLDEDRNEVLRLAAVDGRLVWPLPLNEPAAAMNLNDGMIFVSTASGKILLLNSADGSPVHASKVPQSLVGAAAIDRQRGIIYQPGEHSSLFVFDANSMSCTDVYYLGHKPGTVSLPPLVNNGVVFVVENVGSQAILHVLRANDAGNGLLPACLLYTSPSPRDATLSRMPSSA